MVFVLGVVAMLHVRTREFPEADSKIDTAPAVVHAADTIDVLARVSLPGRRWFPVPPENAAFLEMHVNVVAPATAGLQVPDLQVAHTGRGTQALHIRTKAPAAIGLDRPRSLVGPAAAAELEGTMPGVGQFLGREVRQRDHRFATHFILRRVHAQVHAVVLHDAQFKELADRCVAAVVLSR